MVSSRRLRTRTYQKNGAERNGQTEYRVLDYLEVHCANLHTGNPGVESASQLDLNTTTQPWGKGGKNDWLKTIERMRACLLYLRERRIYIVICNTLTLKGCQALLREMAPQSHQFSSFPPGPTIPAAKGVIYNSDFRLHFSDETAYRVPLPTCF